MQPVSSKKSLITSRKGRADSVTSKTSKSNLKVVKTKANTSKPPPQTLKVDCIDDEEGNIEEPLLRVVNQAQSQILKRDEPSGIVQTKI